MLGRGLLVRHRWLELDWRIDCSGKRQEQHRIAQNGEAATQLNQIGDGDDGRAIDELLRS